MGNEKQLKPLPRVESNIAFTQALLDTFKENLAIATQKVDGKLDETLMSEICKQAHAISQAYMDSIKEAGANGDPASAKQREQKAKNIREEMMATFTQWITDFEPSDDFPTTQADADVYKYFSSAYLDENELKDLDSGDDNEDKLAPIQAGIAKWKNPHKGLTPAQRTELVKDACSYIREQNGPINVERLEYFHFGLKASLDITYKGHIIRVPCDWDALELFVNLVANECLDAEMEKAMTNDRTNFKEFVVHLHISQRSDMNASLKIINAQIRTFTEVVIDNPLFAAQRSSEDTASSSSSASSSSNQATVSGSASQTAPKKKITLDNISEENAIFLVKQIRLFAQWCNLKGTPNFLIDLLNKNEFSKDFLEHYCPNDYLKDSQERPTTLPENVARGFARFDSLKPEQRCKLISDACVLATQQLVGHGYAVTFIPPFIESAKCYFGWTTPINIRVDKDGRNAPISFLATPAGLKSFVETVVKGTLHSTINFKSTSKPTTPVPPRTPTPSKEQAGKSGESSKGASGTDQRPSAALDPAVLTSALKALDLTAAQSAPARPAPANSPPPPPPLDGVSFSS